MSTALSQGCAVDSIWFTKQEMTIKIVDARTMSPKQYAKVACEYPADDGVSRVVGKPTGLTDSDGKVKISFSTSTIKCCNRERTEPTQDPLRDQITGKSAEIVVSTNQASDSLSTILRSGAIASGKNFVVTVESIENARLD